MKFLDRYIQKLRVNAAASHIAHDCEVLDIGCADAALFRRISTLTRYVGVDPDEWPQPEAAQAEYVQGVFPNAQIEDQVFDVITALAVLEHIQPEAQSDFALACGKHLRMDGKLIITVPAPLVDSILDVLMACHILDGMETSQHYGFDPRETPGIFEPAGFTLELHRRFEFGLNHLFVFRRSGSTIY